jgi:hypothetical protein
MPFQAGASMTGAVTSSGPASGSSSHSGSIYSNQLEQRMFDNAAMHSQQQHGGAAGLQDTAAKAAAASVANAAVAAAAALAGTSSASGGGSKPQSSSGGAARSSNSGGNSSSCSGSRLPISAQLIDLAEALKVEEAACKQRAQQLDAEKARTAVAEEKALALGREAESERRRAKVSDGSSALRISCIWGWVRCSTGRELESERRRAEVCEGT